MKRLFKMLTIACLALLSLNVFAERTKLDAKVKAELVDVLKSNEALHQAFFNYDGKKIEMSAKKLSGDIGKISDSKISGLLKLSKDKLQTMTADKNQNDNYEQYGFISNALVYIVNKFDVGKDYNAYSCPMVKKKWVQNTSKDDKVNNPYAASMPHCGSKDSNY